MDCDPRLLPDSPPAWTEKICEILFEKILPLKKNTSIEFLDAAIFGYAYAAISRKLAERASSSPATAEREVFEELRKHYEPTLDVCRRRVTEALADWKLLEAADYLKGFAYGIECQHREKSWMPTATTETMQIYKAFLRHQQEVQSLTRENATARTIGEHIAKRATKSDGMTYTQYFEKNPNSEAKEKFLKFVEKICERLQIPLPARGRPRKNPTPASSAVGIHRHYAGVILPANENTKKQSAVALTET
jgi:hypothetical protein